MHAIGVMFNVIVYLVVIAWGLLIYDVIMRLSSGIIEALRVQNSILISIVQELVDTETSIGEISTRVGGIRTVLDSVTRPAEPQASVLEAPQVPVPHGAPKTLLLMNENHTVAHEVTYHREVPKIYTYGGRVFELLGQNESGQWEFKPC